MYWRLANTGGRLSYSLQCMRHACTHGALGVDEQNTTGMLTLGALVAAGPGLFIGFALLAASEVQKGILRRTDINGIRVGGGMRPGAG